MISTYRLQTTDYRQYKLVYKMESIGREGGLLFWAEPEKYRYIK